MGKHLDHARILLSDQSRPDLAEKELRQELADDPDNGFAHAMLGHALGRQNKNQQGLAEVQKAIGLRPDLDYCHNILAWLLIRLGRFHEALIAIQEAIRLKPNEPDHFQLLSVVLSELNLDQEALEVAEQGLRLNPRNVECLNRRAFALAKLGREKEAEVTFQSALALQPLSNLTYSHLGWFFLGRCCVQRAVESLEEALRIAPNDPYSRNLMLTALRERLTEIHFGLSARYFLVPMLVASCVIWIFGGVESMIAVLVFLPFCFFAV